MLKALLMLAAVAVTLPATAAVNVASPSAGSSVNSPVHFVASGSSANPVAAMQIYADGVLLATIPGASLDTNLPLTTGPHDIAVKVWDVTGWSDMQEFSLNVTGEAAATQPAAVAAAPNGAMTNIQQMPGWDSCTASCAGNNNVVPYSMTEGRVSPSLSGSAAEFWIGGSAPYSSVLWWKELTPTTASHFLYDVNFYVQNPGAVQGMEFDVNQVIGGNRFIFGTECDVRNTGTWRVWDTQNAQWVSTGIACAAPAPYTWHHLTWEFERTAEGKANFVAVTLDGAKSYVNYSYWPRANDGQELSVAFQLDSNYQSENFSAWLDNVNLTAW